MTRIACPTCGRMKPSFAIRNGRCRDDIEDEARASATRHELDWTDIRAERNKRLAACDWTQVADVALSAQEVAAWASYRQGLRDITEAYDTPGEVVWPTPPS